MKILAIEYKSVTRKKVPMYFATLNGETFVVKFQKIKPLVLTTKKKEYNFRPTKIRINHETKSVELVNNI